MKKEDPRITKNRLKYLNSTHKTNQGYEIKIVKYENRKSCNVKFLIDNIIVENLQLVNILGGRVKYPKHKINNSDAFFGEVIKEERRNKINRLSIKSYSRWFKILERTGGVKMKEKQTSYKSTEICKEWLDFKNFNLWFYENYNPETMEGWHIDKDILVKGNKIYSPETCCFVPREINNLFTKRQNHRGDYPIGVTKAYNKYVVYISKNSNRLRLGTYDTPEEAFQAYKIAKEAYIKEVANKWKHLITSQVYLAMINYQVEITD